MPSTATLIRNGTVVNDDLSAPGTDVLCIDGHIVAVEPNIDAGRIPAEIPKEHVRIIDASGKLVIPGGIDPHTHCQLPFMGTVAADDFNHGTRAAVAGGTTMLIDFVIPTKGTSLLAAYNQW